MGRSIKSNLGTKIICSICGNDIKQKERGRLKEYCSTSCSNYIKFFNALERSIESISFADYNHVKRIKSDLFCIVNSMPKEQK
jgi:hypothetical protein